MPHDELTPDLIAYLRFDAATQRERAEVAEGVIRTAARGLLLSVAQADLAVRLAAH